VFDVQLSEPILKKGNEMDDFRYLSGVTTLQLDSEVCVGCGMCENVCPHGVFLLEGKKSCNP
jgi:formate hydrogenlyase subunit 6/NADH:ubiquinone oxidoreductase subunit I